MLPAWLGTNTALREAMDAQPKPLKEMLAWPFYRMQTQMLEMVVAKADIALTRYYAQRLTNAAQQRTVDALGEELRGLATNLLVLTGQPHLLANDPELAESLHVRNTYLDPLHLLQAELLARWRDKSMQLDAVERALKVTMAGIASGLRNTG